MAYLLEGLQFRELSPTFPSGGKNQYGEWKNITGENTFHTGTQFRVAPKNTFVVLDEDGQEVLTSLDKGVAMAAVEEMLASGKAALVEPVAMVLPTVAKYLSDRNIQFRETGQPNWTHGRYFSGSEGVSNWIQFRVLPDTYFEVSITSGIAQSKLTFDDVDKLDKYISHQLRTSDSNITVTRRAYVHDLK